MIIMLTTLSYYEQGKRKQIQIPYYELQNVTQKIYERDKNRVDFDFATFEQKYTYFKPYLDYILLEKNGRLDSFLMDSNNSIFENCHALYYCFKKENRIIPYLCADDKSIMLNERNIDYDALLLNDATSISYEKAKKHDRLIVFYLHYIISQNREIATHYENWIERNKDVKDFNKIYVTCFLSALPYVDFGDYIWYLKADGIESKKQREWICNNDAKPLHTYRLNEEEKQIAKQFIKSFS